MTFSRFFHHKFLLRRKISLSAAFPIIVCSLFQIVYSILFDSTFSWSSFQGWQHSYHPGVSFHWPPCFWLYMFLNSLSWWSTFSRNFLRKKCVEDKWPYSALGLDCWSSDFKLNFLSELHGFPTLSIGEKAMPVWYSFLDFPSYSSAQWLTTKSHALSAFPPPPNIYY